MLPTAFVLFRYLDKSGGNGTQFVGDTKCTKLPVELCGKGCRTEPGPEDCQERAVKLFFLTTMFYDVYVIIAFLFSFIN